MRLTQNTHKDLGFTLVEVLTVIALIVIAVVALCVVIGALVVGCHFLAKWW